MDFNVNIISIIVATIVSMFIGMVWYGPLFGKVWMKLVGMSKKEIEKAKKSGMAGTFIMAGVSTLLFVYVFSILLKNLAITDLLSGLLWAILLWLGFVCTTLLQPILWENKSPKLFFLNSFHKLVEIIFITLILVSF
ncbi:DUF1761 domain-containing protein [Candidatus Woesearchaeota archaeon]|jgi:hypothetical protein|nr:DUF1761 domain-containing protein [Candidatus Woesearchaeota archaeon]MBT4387634.1 DUF1761 domain-containing protein [Candidatus Woesearchaeota archaeon]MBT4596003.1 DUF1761 domain-containing protein [Candidatus Woesearchaeota archaeon]MBT5740710.1 DUF1761 domain-containing protein [Candidatus Woesearchaeota archaeon]MBT6505691.1 DUF1761 domain-containing protein [Candidatus Woesearchaeota archaeon]